LIDRMGLLSRLYRHGQVAYVGGGFEDGIHNLLEPAAWGLPVIFGPRHRKFPEAQALIDAGAGREVRNAEELLMALEGWFGDPEALRIASEAAARYVGERTGGAGRVAAAVLAAI
jgi:3-deoxy-D-manno-octulosonic-acid transferase